MLLLYNILILLLIETANRIMIFEINSQNAAAKLLASVQYFSCKFLEREKEGIISIFSY